MVLKGLVLAAALLSHAMGHSPIQKPHEQTKANTLVGSMLKEIEFTDTYNVLLGDNDIVSVSYLLQDDSLIINLETSVGPEGGWIGFGIGENRTGSMKGADLVTTMIDSTGTPVAEDRHLGWVAYPLSPESAFPIRDQKQDWHVVEAAEANGLLSVTLKRKIDTGDKEEDRVIDTEYENRILVAKGPGRFVSYHGSSRAGTSLDFSRKVPSGNLLDQLENVDEIIEFRMGNYSGFSNRVTTYAEHAFQFDFDEELDIIALEPIISEENLANLHHWVIYDCIVPHQVYPNKTFDTTEELVAITGGVCYTIIAAWAVGGGNFIFPSNVGLRVGGATGIRSVTLEFHYDNPNLRQAVDDSGVRIYATRTLREHEAYVLTSGDPSVNFQQLPAHESCITRRGACTSTCTSKFSHPITIFSSFLHMHARGRQAYTQLNGEVMNKLDYWDFGFQNFKPVSYTVNPGDQLETVCNYDASLATSDVKFFLGSLDEMCMDFIYYYPRDPGAGNCGYFQEDDPNTLCANDLIQGKQDQYSGDFLGMSDFMKNSAVCITQKGDEGDGAALATVSSICVSSFLITLYGLLN